MEALKKQIKGFIQARDWEQYHAPKNLALALSVEAAEILEIFQWKQNDQPLTEEETEALRQEIGDVMIYLVRLADCLGIDPVRAAEEKMRINEKKYPVARSRGLAAKYTEL